MRKTLEATLGLLTPANAQQLAKDMMEPGAAKEQIAKTAADLMDWSQSNRERLTTFVKREVTDQMKNVGVASQSELDALKKRVRDLERAAGKTASGRKSPSGKTPARKTTTRKSGARKTSARKTAATTGPVGGSGSSAGA